jgi:hypothetical protein
LVFNFKFKRRIPITHWFEKPVFVFEPYYKAPLSGVGTGSLPVSSVGINAGVTRQIPLRQYYFSIIMPFPMFGMFKISMPQHHYHCENEDNNKSNESNQRKFFGIVWSAMVRHNYLV